MENPSLTTPLSNIDELVSLFEDRIRYIISKTVLNSSIIDREDLYQAGVTALIESLYSVDRNRPSGEQEAYLYTCIQNAIREEANRFYGCFTLTPRLALQVLQCKKNPDRFLASDPISKVTNHKVEDIYA